MKKNKSIIKKGGVTDVRRILFASLLISVKSLGLKEASRKNLYRYLWTFFNVKRARGVGK